jgi:hypothetical protein
MIIVSLLQNLLIRIVFGNARAIDKNSTTLDIDLI